MRVWNSLVRLGIVFLVSACSSTAIQSMPTVDETNTPSPTLTATTEPTKTTIPTPTTIPAPIDGPLYAWPIPPLSEEQIQEILECQKSTWSGPNRIDPENIETADAPVSACEYAMKAISFASSFDTMELSDPGIFYAQQALLLNPGILFANPFFYFALSQIEIVGSPIEQYRSVSEITINYLWGGIGAPVNYSVNITNNETPFAVGTVEVGPSPDEDESQTIAWMIEQEIPPDLLINIGSAVENLIPVNRQGMMYACFDNYPDWVIDITFDGEESIRLATNHSNFYLEGGPFQTKIADQNYVLGSYRFNSAINKIVNELELPYGQPWAMYCNPYPVVEGLYTDLPIPDYFTP